MGVVARLPLNSTKIAVNNRQESLAVTDNYRMKITVFTFALAERDMHINPCRFFHLLHLEDGHKCFLRNVYIPQILHALLAFLLLFQKFAFSGDISAVTLG